eukprot:192554_1
MTSIHLLINVISCFIISYSKRQFQFRNIKPRPLIQHSKIAYRNINNNSLINYGINLESGILAAPTYAFNVLDYGAVGDGKTDNTKPFETALQTALSNGGGYVFAPTGQYLFKGQINIPDGVSLVGSYLTVPQHQDPKSAPTDGTILMPTFGRKQNNVSMSFIIIGHSAALQGVSIYYPDQPCTSVPVEYPPTIWMNQANSAVFDVELLNSWYGIYAVKAHRHFISRVQGQPIYVGIFVDETYDIGRIENVHWNPWYCNNVN